MTGKELGGVARNESRRSLFETLHGQLYVLTICLIVLWLVEAVDHVLGDEVMLDYYGIRPRDTGHLIGILVAPLLHGGFTHLAANSVPFLVLGWFVLMRGLLDFIVVTLCAAIGSGALIWFVGEVGSVHVGASGVIFGYLGFLLARSLVEHRPGTLFLALIAVFLYGGLILNVVPGDGGVSWEGHLGGLLGGAWLAWALPVRSRARAGPDNS